MKKNEKTKKLTQKDYTRMWGEDGPYSQVRLCEEIRILDDGVSRVFLVVEAEINPFTFEFVLKHRQQFADDEAVLQLFDHAEYQGERGYVVAAGETELRGKDSYRFARKQADMATQTLIRMHSFVMRECGLKKENKFGIIKDEISDEDRFVWDDQIGQVQPVGGGLWSGETLIGSSAGMQDNKVRFFFVLAFEKKFDFKKESTLIFVKALKKASALFKVKIEEVESFMDHSIITALLPFDVAPAHFMEAVLDECDMASKKPIFQKDYLLTNVKRPSPEEIMSFLSALPLDKDVKMPPKRKV